MLFYERFWAAGGRRASRLAAREDAPAIAPREEFAQFVPCDLPPAIRGS